MVLLKTATAVATGILTTGLAATGVGALTHADATTTHSASKAPSAQVRCAPLKKLPARLRTDLRAARALPAGQRGPALRAMREKALHGDYGSTAQRWAEHRIRHHARVAAHLPKDLRQDLRSVHKLPVAQRPAARKAIRAKVIAGGYGATAQKRAEKVAAHRAACRAQRT